MASHLKLPMITIMTMIFFPQNHLYIEEMDNLDSEGNNKIWYTVSPKIEYY